MQSMDETVQAQLLRAQTTLLETASTFVLINGDLTLHSAKRGVAPILDILSEDPRALQGAYIADKVIGRAAALLLVLGGISGLHANLISEHAAIVLDTYGIPFTFGKKVPYIINRDGTDMCPMEKAVLGIDDPKEARNAVVKKIDELRALQENRNA